MNIIFPCRTSFAALLLLAAVGMFFGCNEDTNDAPSAPSLTETHWIVRVKWESYPDTVQYFLYLKPGGYGEDLNENYTTVNNPSKWWQEGSSCGWDYTLQDVSYSGEVASDGLTLQGTCVFRFPIDDDMEGTWRAYRR